MIIEICGFQFKKHYWWACSEQMKQMRMMKDILSILFFEFKETSPTVQ
jgi:hypothetical protein